MDKYRNRLRMATIALLCSLHIGFGLYARQVPLLICGSAGLVYVAMATTMRRYHSAKPAEAELPEGAAVRA